MPPQEKTGIQLFAEDHFSNTFREYDKLLRIIAASSVRTARILTQQAQATKQPTTETKNLSVAMLKASVAYGLLEKAARAAIDIFKATVTKSTLLTARVETLGVSLAVVGKNAGYSEEQIAAFTKGVEDQGITTQAATQSLLQMAQAEIEFTRAADLARMAQDAAVIANINSSEAFQRLVWGIQTGQTRILRTMGITVSFQQAYERLAATLNVTTDDLTEQQKVQARTNAVMEAGAQIAGTYEAAMGTAGKQMLSLARHVEQLQLAFGEIFLGAFATLIKEVTDSLKELREWVDDNEKELKALGTSISGLTSALTELAPTLPLDELTRLVENVTTLTSVLSIGIEVVAGFRKEHEKLFETIKILNQIAVWPATLAGLAVDALTDLRKANADLFMTEKQLYEAEWSWRDELAGRTDDLKKEMDSLKEADREAKRAIAEPPALPDYTEAAEILQKHLDRIQKMQADHLRQLQRAEEDAARVRARAWASYSRRVEKEIKSGQKRLTKTTANYEKQRAKTIADYGKRVAQAEADMQKQRVQAQEDFARRELHTRQRLQLTQLQSERRYQFERNRLIAEGDTLAIEELDARRKLEQQEAKENERLRQRQAREGQAGQIREAGEAAREQLDELRQQLSEALKEQDESYREQIEEQKQANIERLVEMAASYQEQQRLAEEDRALAAQRREEDYRRQLQEQGRALNDQLQDQELYAEQVSDVLNQYYGEGGIADQIMQGYFKRIHTRIQITAQALANMPSAPELGGYMPGGFPATGYGPGLQHGGIVHGPASFHIEPGMVEAVIPLSGNVHHSFGPLNVTGLESASPTDVNAIARGMVSLMAAEVRARRRN